MAVADLIAVFVFNVVVNIGLLGLAGIASAPLLRRTPAYLQYCCWLTLLALCLAVPFAATIPGVHVTIGVTAVRASQATIPIRPYLAVVYLLFLSFRLACFAYSGRRLLRLRQSSYVSADLDSAQAIANDFAERLGTRVAQIRYSPMITAPVACGWSHPIILLPRGFASSVSTAQLQATLAHELAHIRRRDFAVNVVSELLLLPVSFHPIVWWIRKRARASQEQACDAIATADLLDAPAYAQSLVAIARILGSVPVFRPLTGLLSDGLELRVQRLLHPIHRDGVGWALRLSAACVLIAAAVACGSAVQVDTSDNRFSGHWELVPSLSEFGPRLPFRAFQMTTRDRGSHFSVDQTRLYQDGEKTRFEMELPLDGSQVIGKDENGNRLRSSGQRLNDELVLQSESLSASHSEISRVSVSRDRTALTVSGIVTERGRKTPIHLVFNRTARQ